MTGHVMSKLNLKEQARQREEDRQLELQEAYDAWAKIDPPQTMNDPLTRQREWNYYCWVRDGKRQ